MASVWESDLESVLESETVLDWDSVSVKEMEWVLVKGWESDSAKASGSAKASVSDLDWGSVLESEMATE